MENPHDSPDIIHLLLYFILPQMIALSFSPDGKKPGDILNQSKYTRFDSMKWISTYPALGGFLLDNIGNKY